MNQATRAFTQMDQPACPLPRARLTRPLLVTPLLTAVPLADLRCLGRRLSELLDDLDADAGLAGTSSPSLSLSSMSLSTSLSLSLSSSSSAASSAASRQQRARRSDAARYALDDDDHDAAPGGAVEAVAWGGAILAKIFWLEHFGPAAARVLWPKFAEAFVAAAEAAAGTLPAASHLETLRVALCPGGEFIAAAEAATPPSTPQPRPPVSSPLSSSSSSSSGALCWVEARAVAALTARHGSLFAAYMELCDPVTVVYEMGSVEDAPSPAPPRETGGGGLAPSAVAAGGARPAAAGAGGGGAAVMGVVAGAPGAAGRASTVPTLVKGLLGLPIQQICCGGQHAAVLTKHGTILTWGRGGFGRLGHGHTGTVESPLLVAGLLAGQVCVQVACGFAYTAAVTAEGALFTWGAGENGRLGLGDVEDRHAPALVGGSLRGQPVQEVYAGSVHTCVLTRGGRVFSFGKFEYTGHGELGGDDVLLPRRLDAFGDRTVAQVSVGPGGYHTIALTTDREVFTWGHNRVGQLGYSNSDFVPRNGEGAHFLPTPKAVAAMAGLNVRHVVAGWGHSAALTAGGEVLVCGRNFCGQLGLGDPATFPVNERNHPFQAQFVPVKALAGRRAVQVACGGEHSAALTSEGEVFTFGAGAKGQLGHGPPCTNAHYPTLVTALRRTRRAVTQVTCGNNCTLILAGAFSPPSLQARCIEVVQAHAGLMEVLDDIGLPAGLVAQIRETPGVSTC